jgi:porin
LAAKVRSASAMKQRHVSTVLNAMTIPLLVATLVGSVNAQIVTDPPPQAWQDQPYLFGDWGGERAALKRAGVVFKFISVNDFLVDSRGADANWSRIRGTVDIDFGKLELVRGLKFHITGLWQGGGNMGAYIGSIANPSSLVSANTTRLDSWWFEQSLASDKLFIRAGQFAGQDFYGNQASGLSYVMDPLGYSLGNLFTADYESFDPASTPAAEVRVVPTRHIYLKSAAFSGNRNPFHDDVNGLHLQFRDNPVIAAEAGYLVDPTPSTAWKMYPGSYKFGVTTNPGPFDNVVTGVRTSGNYLLYFMANQAVYRPQAGGDQGLDLNFAVDWTPDDITSVYSQVTGGARYHGLIPHRRMDTVAFGIVYSRISGALNHALANLGLMPFGTEKALELNYALQVTRWFTFQPVYQYYFDTGANPLMRNSTVAGFRTTFLL